MNNISVILADDHPVVLAGVKALLKGAQELQLIGESTTGPGALALIRELNPDIAVIDISLPEMSGLDLAQRVSEQCPGVKLLVLTVHEDRAYVQPLLQRGVRGYLLKRSAADELIHAIRTVAAGGIYLDPSIPSGALNDGCGPHGRSDGTNQELSQREAAVMRLTAQGFSNKEIAARLDVSAKTVETHKSRALEKLGIRTRSEIVRYGIGQGWLVDVSKS